MVLLQKTFEETKHDWSNSNIKRSLVKHQKLSWHRESTKHHILLRNVVMHKKDSKLPKWTVTTWRFIITGPRSFQQRNLVNMRFICTKLCRPERKIMLCDVLSEFPKYMLLLPCNICISVTSWDGLINVLITAAVGHRWALSSVCVHVSKRKADTLNTELSSSLV